MKRILKHIWPWSRILDLEAKLKERDGHLRKAGEIIAMKGGISIKGKKRKVPAVLLSGDHKKISDWRKNKK